MIAWKNIPVDDRETKTPALNYLSLVLNQNYLPVAIASAQRAICLVYTKKVSVLEDYEGVEVHSPSTTMIVPSVIRLRNYVHFEIKRVGLNRKNILIRDNFRCQYCDRTGYLTIDHVIPKADGGQNIWENMVAACEPCNLLKGDRRPEEVGLELLKSPKRPHRYYQFRQVVRNPQSMWRPYLFMDPL